MDPQAVAALLLASLLGALVTFGLTRRALVRATAGEAARRRWLFDASPDGMVVLDPASLRIIEFNTAAHVQLGYSREAFGRLHLRDIEAMETDEELRRRIDEVLERGRSDYETLHRTKGGELRDIHVTAQVIQAGGQQIYQCVWRDVTERRRAELALRDAHERLRRLGDNLPGGYVYQVVMAPDGARRFTYASAGVEQVHGVTVADALRDPATIYGLSPEPEQRRIRALEERSARELTPFTAEVEVRSPTGGAQWLQLSAAPGQLADGSVRWDGIALDVTGRHRMEADRLVASKLESTGILAGGLAHDFNNLLTTVLMGVELARMDDRTDGRGGAAEGDPLDEVVAAVMAARDLTQQLITFSRGGAPVRRVTEVERVVRDSTTLALTGANVTRRLVVEPGLWTAELDEGQFAQVVRNLVLNAREAMPAGGVVTVTLRNVRLGAASGPARSRATAWSSWWPTPGSASPRRRCPGSSTPTSRRSTAARRRAWGSGSRSATRSCASTAGRSTSTRRRGRGPGCGCSCRRAPGWWSCPTRRPRPCRRGSAGAGCS
ncbi:MAG: PAS domain S-box protein [Anaeromyxobacter sp.]